MENKQRQNITGELIGYDSILEQCNKAEDKCAFILNVDLIVETTEYKYQTNT